MAVLAFANPTPPTSGFPSFPDGCKAITASDTDTFERPVAVYVGVAGNVSYTPANGEANVTLTMVAGSYLPSRAKAVLSTGAGLPPPVNAAFVQADTGGSLVASTTYYYRVSAINATGESLASTETSQATSAAAPATHTMTVNWAAVTGATGYKVYGRSTGAELLIATVGAVLTYLDTGSITPSGALPAATTTASGLFAAY
jgi:hypothetical protein